MQKMPVAQLVNMFDGEIHRISEEICMIGRQSDENGITVNEGIVSREHAVIRFEENRYVIQDSGSRNGTFLNGERLAPGVSHKLKHEDVIGFSKLKYLFQILAREENKIRINGMEGEIEISGGRKRLIITIPKERLVKYQQKMQENNKIKGILQPSCLDAGDRVLLYYEIDGLKKWENIILKQEIQEKEILKLLLQITETIGTVSRYLLPEGNLILEPGMIFVNRKGMAKLIHLPVNKEEEAPGIERALLSAILFALPQYRKQWNGSDEESQSPMQIQRYLRERIQTLRQEEQPAGQKPDMAGKEGTKQNKKSGKRIITFKDKGSNLVWIFLFQIPVLLLVAGIYASQLLKQIDFLGFFIITAAIDIWIVKTWRGTKEKPAKNTVQNPKSVQNPKEETV